MRPRPPLSLRLRGLVLSAAVGSLCIVTACDADEVESAPSSKPDSESSDAPPTKAAGADPGPRPGPGPGPGPQTLALPTDLKQLPTGSLEASALLADACAFLPAEVAANYLSFVTSDIRAQSREQRDRAACTLLAPEPETKFDVWFDATKQLRSNERAIELGGVADVRLRVSSRSAELTIPFPAAKDASKSPADRLVMRVTLFEHASVMQPYPGPPKVEEAQLEAILRQLGENAIARLGL